MDLRFVDDSNNIIPDAWRQLVSWTLCRAVTAGTDSGAGEGECLVIPKTRGAGAGAEGDDEALRIASKSSAGSPGKWDAGGRRSPGSSSPPECSVSLLSSE